MPKILKNSEPHNQEKYPRDGRLKFPGEKTAFADRVKHNHTY